MGLGCCAASCAFRSMRLASPEELRLGDAIAPNIARGRAGGRARSHATRKPCGALHMASGPDRRSRARPDCLPRRGSVLVFLILAVAFGRKGGGFASGSGSPKPTRMAKSMAGCGIQALRGQHRRGRIDQQRQRAGRIGEDRRGWPDLRRSRADAARVRLERRARIERCQAGGSRPSQAGSGCEPGRKRRALA